MPKTCQDAYKVRISVCKKLALCIRPTKSVLHLAKALRLPPKSLLGLAKVLRKPRNDLAKVLHLPRNPHLRARKSRACHGIDMQQLARPNRATQLPKLEALGIACHEINSSSCQGSAPATGVARAIHKHVQAIRQPSPSRQPAIPSSLSQPLYF